MRAAAAQQAATRAAATAAPAASAAGQNVVLENAFLKVYVDSSRGMQAVLDKGTGAAARARHSTEALFPTAQTPSKTPTEAPFFTANTKQSKSRAPLLPQTSGFRLVRAPAATHT